MKSKQTQDVMLEALESFASTIQSKFGAVVDGREEDQLRRPVDELLEKIGRSQNLNVVAKDESTLDDKLGRPDFAVTSGRGPLLAADQLGAPPDEYRKPPANHGTQNEFEI